MYYVPSQRKYDAMFKVLTPQELLRQLPFDAITAVTYNLFYRILDDPEAFSVLSDDKDCVAAQNLKNAMWLWVSDTCPDDRITEYSRDLVSLIGERFVPSVIGSQRSITTFYELYANAHFIKTSRGMSMTAYHCPQVNPHYISSCHVCMAGNDDIEIIAEFCAGFTRDAFNNPTDKNEYLKVAERLIRAKSVYVVHNGATIVSMANIAHKTDRFARINLVYTPHEYRKKGYASHIVTALTEKIISEGLMPMLYTDDTNATSNNIYQSIGYVETGRLTTIEFGAKNT